MKLKPKRGITEAPHCGKVRLSWHSGTLIRGTHGSLSNARTRDKRGRANMKDAMPSTMRAHEIAQNASKSAQASAAARAQHLEATRPTETLIALFVSTLELRSTHARFAVHFLGALDLRTACITAGIGYETGRTYLKKLFEVTGSKSQVELVVILAWVVRS